MLKTLNDLSLKLAAAAMVYGGSVLNALAQSTGTDDPGNVLDILKTGRQKAQNSNLNADSISSGGSKVGFVIMVLGGIVGIGYALNSGMRLYKATQDPSAHEDKGRAIMGIVIGSGITVFGIFIGVLVNYMIGNN